MLANNQIQGWPTPQIFVPATPTPTPANLVELESGLGTIELESGTGSIELE
jgi:hypothetical protein